MKYQCALCEKKVKPYTTDFVTFEFFYITVEIYIRISFKEQ